MISLHAFEGDPRESLQEGIHVALEYLNRPSGYPLNALIVCIKSVIDKPIIDKSLRDFSPSDIHHLRRIQIRAIESFDDTFDLLNLLGSPNPDLLVICMDSDCMSIESSRYRNFCIFTALLSEIHMELAMIAPNSNSHHLRNLTSWIGDTF